MLEVLHPKLGRERHVLAREALDPLGAGSLFENILQLERDLLIVLHTILALRIACDPILVLDRAAKRLPELVGRGHVHADALAILAHQVIGLRGAAAVEEGRRLALVEVEGERLEVECDGRLQHVHFDEPPLARGFCLVERGEDGGSGVIAGGRIRDRRAGDARIVVAPVPAHPARERLADVVERRALRIRAIGTEGLSAASCL